MQTLLITDFTHNAFQQAFKTYFQELGIQIKNWEGLFQEMNNEGDNLAYVLLDDNGRALGFIQLKPIQLANWFFEEHLGFIREFWIAETARGKGYGSQLLQLAESYLQGQKIPKAILTTHTAEAFYLKKGYRRDFSFLAKNEDPVYIKDLFQENTQKGNTL